MRERTMGTMKLLIASNCIEEEIPVHGFPPAKKIKYFKITPEEFKEMLKQVEEHWNDPLPKFYDYPSTLVSPIDRAPLRNADQLLGYDRR